MERNAADLDDPPPPLSLSAAAAAASTLICSFVGFFSSFSSLQ
jgi:hypothetical protein